jgi:NadR type nicotinamide-nucleotide adenylyltransferase
VSKRFQRGLVIGKFSPLHRGHEYIIRQALAACEEVLLISYSKPEMTGCAAVKREAWIAALFPGIRHLAVTDERLIEWARGGWSQGVPANDADETTQRRFCGFLCQKVLGTTVDAVFTSEDYGGGFANELTRYFREEDAAANAVEHVLVDRARLHAPISGSMIRQNVHEQREWLSPIVYASFVQRICLLGGESSGKSTLAVALAAAFSTRHVAEYGREMWEQKAGALEYDDLLHIAKTQVQREEDTAGKSNRFLFCDTSPLTTLFYSRHLFGKADLALEKLAESTYDLTLLCAPDFPFVQDGTRQPDSFRIFQHEWYLRELSTRQIPYHVVTGPIAQRIAQVREWLLAPSQTSAAGDSD